MLEGGADVVWEALRALQVVPDLRRHPLPGLLSACVPVTVNSDDPAYFGGYLDANLDAIKPESSFLPSAEKALLLASAAG